MKKIIIVFLLLGFVLVVGCTSGQVVDVTGSYTSKVTPDLGIISVFVDTLKDSAEEAQENNAYIISEIKKNLRVAGLDENDLETVSFNVYPEYDWTDNGRVLKGYRATHSLDLTVDDIDSIGAYLDIVVKSGVNQINNIRFEIDDSTKKELQVEALQKATEDARVKAGAIASGLGKKVGKVVSISDSTVNVNPWFYKGGAMLETADAAAITEISFSDVEVRADVTAKFKLN